MKCFLISNMYPSVDNPGYGVFIKNIEDGLNQYGCRVVCKSVIKGRGSNIVSKILKYLSFFVGIIINYFKSYDFIYLHYPTYSSPILYLLLKIKKTKIVVNYHGEDLLYDDNYYATFLGRIADALTKKYSSLVVVPSQYYKDIVIQRELKRLDDIYISPSGGISSAIFYPLKTTKKNELVVGYVGRLQDDKGVIEYILACKNVMKEINIKAYIIGYGPLLETVKQQIVGDNQFELIEGVDQRQLALYYNLFDIFCFPSKRKTESLGLVGLEAMACGIPVIGTNIGGIPTYLENLYNGYLISLEGLIDNISNSILRYYYLDKIKKDRMMENCVKTAEWYSQDQVILRLVEQFKKI